MNGDYLMGEVGCAGGTQVKFHNTGPRQLPGVIVMEMTSADAVKPVSSSQEDMLDVEEVYMCPTYK
jgi:hypothetical protein